MKNSKVIVFKAKSIQKNKPELTFKEAFRIASIKHNYKTKRSNYYD